MFHGNIWPYYYWLLYCHILPCLICLLGFSKVWRHKLVHWSRWRAIESVPRCWDQPPTNQISLPATASDGHDQGWLNTGSRNDVLFRQNSLVKPFFPMKRMKMSFPIGIIGYSMESYPFYYSINGNRESQLGWSLISLGKRASSIFTFSCFGDIWRCPAMECTQHCHQCISMDLPSGNLT